MSEDNVTASPDRANHKDILLYDYSKHLLSLAILGIGGVASLAQSTQGQNIPAPVISMVIGFLAVAGFCALSCTAMILRARQDDKPTPPKAWSYSRGAMMFLGMSVGSFLTIWIMELLK